VAIIPHVTLFSHETLLNFTAEIIYHVTNILTYNNVHLGLQSTNNVTIDDHTALNIDDVTDNSIVALY